MNKYEAAEEDRQRTRILDEKDRERQLRAMAHTEELGRQETYTDRRFSKIKLKEPRWKIC